MGYNNGTDLGVSSPPILITNVQTCNAALQGLV